MFLAPDLWLGVDIGHVGSAVLYAALLLFAIHLSKHSDAVFQADAPLAERQAWVSVAFITLIACLWVNFIVDLPELGAYADLISNSASRAFSVHFGMLIAGWAIVTGMVRSANGEEVELDERDLRIRHAANRAGSGLAAMLIIGLIGLLAIPPELLAPWLRPMIVANALIGLLIAHTLTQNVFIVMRYRRSHS